MNQEQNKHSGIRLSRLNFFFIIVGLVIAVLMIYSMIQTSNSFRQIVSVTESYLSSQQTAGMLKNISDEMSEKCVAFVHSGTPDLTYAYFGQYEAITAQVESDSSLQESGASEDEFMAKALNTFETMKQTEIRAMRLVADTLPMGMEAFSPRLQAVSLSAEDAALSPEEKKALALSLISSEEYLSCSKTIAGAVDDSHRIASEKGKNRAVQTEQNVRGVINTQTVLVLLFLAVAVLALIMNRFLIIRPIQRSVDNLDRREPIPVQGSYEVRHLAQVYNDVLKDNVEKAAALSYAASHDALTGLYNRAAFDKVYQQYKDGHTGVMIADVDHFKQYNDEFGHDVGDHVLKIVADKLTEHFRTGDFICRIGGDEFCVIMPDIPHSQSDTMVEKIRTINKELAELGEGLPPISLSAGFAFWDRPNPKGDLLKDADFVLLKLKKTRADCCAVYA